MIVSRGVSLLLRAAQFVFAGIVVGLTAYFLYQRTRHDVGPLGRTLYTLVVAGLSVIASLIWMIPTKSNIASWASDLFFSVAWFAAFGLIFRFYRGTNCGSVGGDHCGRWKATQAFSFISACVWLLSFILGIITYQRLKRNAGGSHRSRV